MRTTIVSAGLTDIICSFLQLHGLRFDSLEITANRCVWSGDSDDAVLTGFKEGSADSQRKQRRRCGRLAGPLAACCCELRIDLTVR